MTITLQLITAPTDVPFNLTEAKEHLRVTDTASDSEITRLTHVAVQRLEHYANVRYMAQVWDLILDDFPQCAFFQVPLWPITSVTHLKYYASDGTLTTMNSADYILSGERHPPQITLAPTIGQWPSIQANRVDAVQIRLAVGRAIGDVAKIPATMIQAAKFVLGHLYENREDEANPTVPTAAEILMFSHKLWFP